MEDNIAKYKLYCHTLLEDGRKYIGITRMKTEKRWRKNGQGYKTNSYFYRAIQKYGWDNFKHEILFDNLTKKQAHQKEIELIELYKTQDEKFGFNLTGGGEGGYIPCERTREKMRKSAMRNKSHLGCKHTQEMKDNMRQIKQEYWSKEENRKKQSIANGWQKKKVVKINKDTNEIICIYNSLSEASKGYLKTNISHCCHGKLKTAYGYKWKFLEEVIMCQS